MDTEVSISEKVQIVVDSLQPNMAEYADNEKFFYWMDYACTLDDILHIHSESVEEVVTHVNKLMMKLSLTPEHHAATDVASTLEAFFHEFQGVFKYE